MSIFDGIFSPQTQTGFGSLMASGALGQLGAGLHGLPVYTPFGTAGHA